MLPPRGEEDDTNLALSIPTSRLDKSNYHTAVTKSVFDRMVQKLSLTHNVQVSLVDNIAANFVTQHFLVSVLLSRYDIWFDVLLHDVFNLHV